MTRDEKVHASVSELFDQWATSGRAEQMEAGHTHAALQAFERLSLDPGQRYLDIGCGNGYSVRWAAAVDPTITAVGMDVSEAMIVRAREMSTQFSNARFIHAPFPLPMLKAGSFNAILSMEVFYYLPDLTWGLQNVARLLKPGGLFACLVDFYEENTASHSWPEMTGLKMRLLSEETWHKAMEHIGFEVIEQARLRAPENSEEPDWKKTEGTLMTLVRRPAEPAE